MCSSSRASIWKLLSSYLWMAFYCFLICIIFHAIISNIVISLIVLTFAISTLYIVLTIVCNSRQGKGENHLYVDF